MLSCAAAAKVTPATVARSQSSGVSRLKVEKIQTAQPLSISLLSAQLPLYLFLLWKTHQIDYLPVAELNKKLGKSVTY